MHHRKFRQLLFNHFKAEHHVSYKKDSHAITKTWRQFALSTPSFLWTATLSAGAQDDSSAEGDGRLVAQLLDKGVAEDSAGTAVI
jgi:hypothetical protein